MVILQRGIPAHVKEKNLRKSYSVSLSDSERNRYATEAQARGMSLSLLFRTAADKYLANPPTMSRPEYADLLAEQDEAAALGAEKSAWLTGGEG
jgi:hypothetical protein